MCGWCCLSVPLWGSCCCRGLRGNDVGVSLLASGGRGQGSWVQGGQWADRVLALQGVAQWNIGNLRTILDMVERECGTIIEVLALPTCTSACGRPPSLGTRRTWTCTAHQLPALREPKSW